MRSRMTRWAMATVVGLLAAGRAEAGVLLSNLDGNDGTSTSLIGPSDGSKGQGFTMNSGTSFSLDDVVLRLAVETGADPLVQIYSNGPGNKPSMLLDTLADPAFATTDTFVDYTFHTSTPFTLVAGTAYWVVLSNLSGQSYEAWATNSPSLTPTGPSATYLGAAFSPTGPPPPTNDSSNINSFRVDGTAIAAVATPEPATLAQAGAGLLATAGFVGWRRRRRIAG